MSRIAIALFALLAGALPARADFHTVGGEFVLSNRLYNGDHYGDFQIWTNDGRGISISPGAPYPNPGQVQFDYYVSSQIVGKDYPYLVDAKHQFLGLLPVYGNDYTK